MNDEFLKRAKEQAKNALDETQRKAEELRGKMSPHMQKALDETQEQAESALTELGGLFRRAAKAVRDDISKRA